MKTRPSIYLYVLLFCFSTISCRQSDTAKGRITLAPVNKGDTLNRGHVFRKILISDEFWCEGVGCSDFNHDGTADICGGPFWWEGPDYKIRHEFRPGAGKTSNRNRADGIEITFGGFSGAKGSINDYSDNFLTYVEDFNNDGWDDIIVCDFPGKDAFWYENPKDRHSSGISKFWKSHLAISVLENESPVLGDINGDSKPEMICNSQGYLGFATPDPEDPTLPWIWHPISPKGQWQQFTHGIGIGDINGDNRVDLLEQNGWWEQPLSLAGDPLWVFHEFSFTPGTGTAGAAQMLVYDFNGDGHNDVLTTLNPHSYGIAWYEQVRENTRITFRRHMITGREQADNKYGVKFSQAHALNLVDIDGDGLKDIVTGKRFWAHGPEGDDEPNAPAVLYWFRTVRNMDKTVDFIPSLIDNNSGVGMQITLADVSNDGLIDLAIGNKKGIFVFIHEISTSR